MLPLAKKIDVFLSKACIPLLNSKLQQFYSYAQHL